MGWAQEWVDLDRLCGWASEPGVWVRVEPVVRGHKQQQSLIHIHANPLAAGVTQPPSPRRHAPPLPLLSSSPRLAARTRRKKGGKEKDQRNCKLFTLRPPPQSPPPTRPPPLLPGVLFLLRPGGPHAVHAKQPKSLRAFLISSSFPRIPLPQHIGSSAPKDGRRRQ